MRRAIYSMFWLLQEIQSERDYWTFNRLQYVLLLWYSTVWLGRWAVSEPEWTNRNEQVDQLGGKSYWNCIPGASKSPYRQYRREEIHKKKIIDELVPRKDPWIIARLKLYAQNGTNLCSILHWTHPQILASGTFLDRGRKFWLASADLEWLMI